VLVTMVKTGSRSKEKVRDRRQHQSSGSFPDHRVLLCELWKLMETINYRDG